MRILRVLTAAGLSATLLSSSALAAGDAGHGKTVFERCAICHVVVKGGPNGIGPNLFGVVGRKAGTAPQFNYSDAMKNSGITWTPDKLAAYVHQPQAVVPGNRMAFAGITSKQDVDDVVTYLQTLK